MERKLHFRFKEVKKNRRRVAKLIYVTRHSNIFITLLDSKNKVICCRTSGCNPLCFTKKKKTTYPAVESLVDMLEPILKLYKIKTLIVIFKCKPRGLCYRLLGFFAKKGIKILKVKVRLKCPHNGVKGGNIRRNKRKDRW
jgi:ribosomal protein S11